MAAYEQDGGVALEAGVAEGRRRRTMGQRLKWPLMILAPVIILVIAGFFYLTGGRIQSTDDAYVQAARVNISTNVAGRVVQVLVHENETVKAGQVLFRLDTRDFDAAIQAAQAQLASARLQVRSTQATYDPRAADVAAAQLELAYREKELARQRTLTASGVGSQRELDERTNDVTAARARLTAARAALAQAVATIGGSATGPVDANPAVQQAQAALDRALLNKSYTVIYAPQAGLVTRVDQLQVGSYVTAAQPLFNLVAPRMWIDANFKEDQLTFMRPGQRGTAKIDAFPGRRFNVHVESLSPGTGSSFSLLPAENATGNWVKVTQRLPVRIAFDDANAVRPLLHAGLSANVEVDTGHSRSLFGHAMAPAGQTRSAP